MKRATLFRNSFTIYVLKVFRSGDFFSLTPKTLLYNKHTHTCKHTSRFLLKNENKREFKFYLKKNEKKTIDMHKNRI
jgi:hypothetical protein